PTSRPSGPPPCTGRTSRWSTAAATRTRWCRPSTTTTWASPGDTGPTSCSTAPISSRRDTGYNGKEKRRSNPRIAPPLSARCAGCPSLRGGNHGVIKGNGEIEQPARVPVAQQEAGEQKDQVDRQGVQLPQAHCPGNQGKGYHQGQGEDPQKALLP